MKIKLSIICLCALMGAMTTHLAAAPETDPAGGGDARFHDREFRNWVGLAGHAGSSGASYRSFGSASSYFCANTSPGGNRIVRYAFTLPQDRFLERVRVWGFKEADTTDVTLRLRKSCMSQSQTVPSTETLSTATIDGAPGEFSQALVVSETVNNLNCKYWLEVNFGPTSEACAVSANRLGIHKIRTQSTQNSDWIFRDDFRIHAPD